jgi:hypothetical protein
MPTMNSTSLKTFYQAVLFGVVTVLLGLILSMVFSFMKPTLADECKNWNKYYVMEVVLFLTGFIIRYMLTNNNILKYMYEL